MLRLKQREGFTLIELMIVVAIIGILAAVAIPNFIRYQLRTRAGEGRINLAAIRTAEEAYLAEFGRYVPFVSTPNAPGVGLGAVKTPWVACPIPVVPASPGHCILGWEPDGPTYYNYVAATDVTAASGNPGCPVGSVLDMTANPPVPSRDIVGPCAFDFGSTVF